MEKVYVLLLQYNKYYIGKSKNVSLRLQQHNNGNGSEWTKVYKPIKIIETINNGNEDTITIHYMKKYGIENVRGGSFCNIYLTDETKKVLQKMIATQDDLCFICNMKGHFANECNNIEEKPIPLIFEEKNGKFCCRCFRTNHYASNCYANTMNDGSEIGNHCYRCGKMDHWKIRCNSTHDICGNEIKEDVAITRIVYDIFSSLFKY